MFRGESVPPGVPLHVFLEVDAMADEAEQDAQQERYDIEWHKVSTNAVSALIATASVGTPNVIRISRRASRDKIRPGLANGTGPPFLPRSLHMINPRLGIDPISPITGRSP